MLDVEAEIERINAKVRHQIEMNTRTALRRIDRPTPAEKRELAVEIVSRTSDAMYELGLRYGELARSLQEAAERMAAGFAAAFRDR